VKVYEEMREGSRGSLRNTKNSEERLQLDLRYVGQDFTLSVPVAPKDLRKGDRKAIRTAFDKLYEHRYAHSSPDDPVEMVNMRLSVIGKRPTLKFPRIGKGRASAISHRRDVYFADAKKAVRCPVYQRPKLTAGTKIVGPALVQEHGTTTVLFQKDVCTVAPSGELIIKVGGA
jgi:N-methylhydantoinase A